MPDRIWSGLATAWAADSMATTFPGGIHAGRQAEPSAWPYVAIIDMGNALQFLTSGGESGGSQFRRHIFQVEIWYKAASGADPYAPLGTLMRTFDSFMQSHNRDLFYSASEGRVLYVENMDERIMEGEDDRVYFGQIDYRARRHKVVTK